MVEYKIYLLKCRITGLCYVGVTSVPLKTRWANGKGYKRQPVIYKDIVKYGWDNFTHGQIDVAFNYQESREKERFYINKYNSVFPNGYNVIEGETGTPNKLLLSPIICVNDEGKIIHEYSCLSETRQDLTENQYTQLRNLLYDAQARRSSKYYMDGYWGLKIHYTEILEKLPVVRKRRNKGSHNGVCLPVAKVDEEGIVVCVYRSQREAVRQTENAKKTSMQTAITKGKQYLGLYWRYVNK